MALCLVGAGLAHGQSPTKPEPTVRSVLVLGDSHAAGYFGRQLHKQLRAAYPDAKVTLVGACGKAEGGFLHGSPAHCGVMTIHPNGRVSHAKGCKRNPCKDTDGPKCEKRACRPPKLRKLLPKMKPDITILQLGGNSWFTGNMEKGWPSVARNANKVAALIRKHQSLCVWVTPSDHYYRPADSQDAFATFYEETLKGKCAVFNSRPSHHPYLEYGKWVREKKLKKKQHDGIHYGWFKAKGREIQKRWAADIITVAKDHWNAMRVATPIEVPKAATP